MHCLLKKKNRTFSQLFHSHKMSLSSNRILGGGGGGGGGGCKKDIQTAVIKTKNVGENRKNRKKTVSRSFFFSFPFPSVE